MGKDVATCARDGETWPEVSWEQIAPYVYNKTPFELLDRFPLEDQGVMLCCVMVFGPVWLIALHAVHAVLRAEL